MIMRQLSLWRDAPPTLTLALLADVELRPAVFYFAVRELAAGRPCPVDLTDEQRTLVDCYL